ncbi:nicotinamidase isoform X2 [Hydra vulgaris]|uniref:nicotinamidase isoform X2 n=1 Tax=Hydra vulgaris TaxID=6087 RepID=UPI001F5EF93B|nr:nicotinamidase isoform X2 [Hydra vulgaris]
MKKLNVLTSYFNALRENQNYKSLSEDEIYAELNKMELYRFEKVLDLPENFVSDVIFNLTNTKLLDNEKEKEIIDYLNKSLVNGIANLRLISKCLRYLLRKETDCHNALIVIDVQNDFISGNLSLKNSPAGQDGEEVVNIINSILDLKLFCSVYYTLDWHKEDHCSFVNNVKKYPLHESFRSMDNPEVFTKVIYDGEIPREQVLWPSHCIQNSSGAELHPNLKIIDGAKFIYKGQHSHCDSYSAFWDNSKFSQTELFFHLLDNNIQRNFICGLALDFCVGFTSLDSAEHGFDTFVILDATRGVSENTIEEMKNRMNSVGVKLVTMETLLSFL